MSQYVPGQPINQPGLETWLRDIDARLGRLERGPTGSGTNSAFYEMKVFSDLDTVTTVDLPFLEWAVPPSLDGWTLVQAFGFVSQASSAGDIVFSIIDLDQASADLFTDPITIEQGDKNSFPAGTQPTFSGVVLATGDALDFVISSAGFDAIGLGCGLTFIPA